MIEFYDREKEIEEIIRILGTRPDLITFIYGPINSGKTELLNNLIGKLGKDYVVFYVNLRGKFITDYEDFIRVLFRFRDVSKDEILKEVLKKSLKALSFKGIPVPESVVDLIFSKKRTEDVFEFLEDYLTNVAEKKVPVLIIDELQVIGDLKVDELLIYKLFNFFIRLTKELHCCHVFAVTSDSLFIERVYSEAMLQGRCRYILVDDFDHKTTEGFLRKYGFSEEEIKVVWEYFGGKPVYLVEAVKNKHRLKDFCEEMLKIRVGQIEEVVFRLEVENKELFKSVVELLGEVKEKEKVRYRFVTNDISFLVRNNVLFADPVTKTVKPQSKLDLLAIRDVI